jgi:hypothetical protein
VAFVPAQRQAQDGGDRSQREAPPLEGIGNESSPIPSSHKLAMTRRREIAIRSTIRPRERKA